MKNWIIGSIVVAMLAAFVPTAADAKRLGGSRSSGMQRDMPARTAPDAPPAKPAAPAAGNTPAQPGAAAPAAAGATAAAAAGAKRSWLGPIAGLAAGLGLVALASALGFGEELANFLMIALLAVAAIALIAFLMRRFGRKPQPALAGGAATRSGAQVSWPTPASPEPAAANNAPAQFSGQGAAPGVTDPVPGLARGGGAAGG
jgi:predicted lipid-binding transport protein (Tim44 family)